MSFAIVAEFPQGVYHGHLGEGQLDLLPAIDRVHAALLAAAGQGLRAVEGADGGLHPNADDVAALEWLEQTPPDGLALPIRTANESGARAYRDLGLLKPRGGVRKVPKRDNHSVALGGSLAWVWEDDPPGRVRDSLDELCPDVAYLGQSDSPVRMRTETASPRPVTHRRDPEARTSTSRSTDVDLAVPRPGRTGVLMAAHDGRAGARLPTPAQDRAKAAGEDEVREPVTSGATGRERYVPTRSVSTTPWVSYWVVPFRGQRVQSHERVAFAVAMHRTLIAKHGLDAPPLLTGKYASATDMPANRLAIQVVDDHPSLAHRFGSPQAFVFMVPRGADPYEVASVTEALAAASRVYALGRGVTLDAPLTETALDASEFWAPPAEQMARVWQVLPAAVETRAQGSAWTLADAVTLSVALVWRDVLGDDVAPLRGEQRYRALVGWARDRGVEVLSAQPITRTPAQQYVHRTSEGLMPKPYRAQVTLGDLERAGTALVAIGQSRHLGGGLLVPLDAPPEIVDTWRMR